MSGFKVLVTKDDDTLCKGCGKELPKGFFVGKLYMCFNWDCRKRHPKDGFYCGACYNAIKTKEKGPTPEELTSEVLQEMSQRMQKMGVITTAHIDAGRELIAQAIRDAIERAIKYGAH